MRNGVRKTTTLRLLLGLAEPTGGAVTIGGTR
jgi:ABC-type sugar transport system ATPase subunit